MQIEQEQNWYQTWEDIDGYLFEKYCLEGEDEELIKLYKEHDQKIAEVAIEEYIKRNTESLKHRKDYPLREIELSLCCFAKDKKKPLKETKFIITEDFLNQYLVVTRDDRNTEDFLKGYSKEDNSESDARQIYSKAKSSGQIRFEETTYCDDFIKKYNAYIEKLEKLFGRGIHDNLIMSKEEYFIIQFIHDKAEKKYSGSDKSDEILAEEEECLF